MRWASEAEGIELDLVAVNSDLEFASRDVLDGCPLMLSVMGHERVLVVGDA